MADPSVHIGLGAGLAAVFHYGYRQIAEILRRSGNGAGHGSNGKVTPELEALRRLEGTSAEIRDACVSMHATSQATQTLLMELLREKR